MLSYFTFPMLTSGIFLLFSTLNLSGSEPPQNLSLQTQGENNIMLNWEAPEGEEAELVFHESFEGLTGTTFPPEGWQNVDNDGDAIKWILFDVPYSESVNPYPAHDGIYAAASYSWFNGSTLTPDNWLITPAITAPANGLLQWAVAAQRPNYSQEHYKVYISTTGNNVSDFTTLLHEETLPEQDITWDVKQVDLSQYAGQQIYIAFVHTQTTDLFAIKLDDIRVYGTSANHSGYRIYRNDQQVALTDALTKNYYDAGLEPGDYQYYVTAVYGDTESAPSNVVNATIEIPVLDFPPLNLTAETSGSDVILSWQQPDLQTSFLWEDFEDITDQDFPPAGWNNIDNDNGGMAWILFDVPYSESVNPYPAYSGEQAIASYSWFNGNTYTPDNWIITPPVSLGTESSLSWAAAGQRPDYSHEHYRVYISTTGSDVSDFNTLLFEETMPEGDITWKEREIDISDYDGQEVHIAFVHTGTSDLFAIKLDAILLDGKAGLELTGFQVFRNGEMISEINDADNTGFTDTDLPDGEYIYHVRAVFDKGISSDSQPAQVTVAPMQEYNVDISVQGQGTVTPGTGQFTYASGSSLEIIATPAENWKFDNWIINQQSIDQDTYTVVVNQDLQITAVFSEDDQSGTGSIPVSKISVYPNPSSGIINISSAEALVNANIGIYNITGQLVWQKEDLSGTNLELNLQDVNSGVYMLRISGVEQSIRLILK